jgi:hypothetical protein
MWHDIAQASWANKWAAISAVFSMVAVCVAIWAMLRWKNQDKLKAKMALKMAVADYSNSLSQMPIHLSTSQLRIDRAPEIRSLRGEINAVKNALLICEDILNHKPNLVKNCRELLAQHNAYVRGNDSSVTLQYICKLILSEKFVFN